MTQHTAACEKKLQRQVDTWECHLRIVQSLLLLPTAQDKSTVLNGIEHIGKVHSTAPHALEDVVKLLLRCGGALQLLLLLLGMVLFHESDSSSAAQQGAQHIAADCRGDVLRCQLM